MNKAFPRDDDLERRIAQLAREPQPNPGQRPVEGLDVRYHPTPNAHPIPVVVPDPRRPGILVVNVFGGLSKQQQLAAMLLNGLLAEHDMDRETSNEAVASAMRIAQLILDFIPPAPAAAGEAAAPELRGS